MNELSNMGSNAMLPLRFNFVFFFANYDYWKAILGKELYESPNVKVYEGAFEGSRFQKKLFHLHWAYRINRIIKLPMKWIWFKKMYEQDFPEKLPLCFVYMGGNNIYADGGFTDYVRRRDPRNRQIILHNDLISKKCDYEYAIIRNKVDLATTYDQDEAEKYHIHYFREDTYSKIMDLPEKDEFEYDVYFLGAAKDRLTKIMNVYTRLSKAGFNCKFLLAGVPEEQQIKADGIDYINHISYEENIQYVIKSRCIIEVIQKDSVDITTRALEAIAYQRKLLTDCQIVPSEYFNPGQLQVFQKPEDINVAFLQDRYESKDYPPQFDMNPLRRLYDFQEQLEKQS